MTESGWPGCVLSVFGNTITTGNFFNFSTWGELPFIIGTAFFSVASIIMLIYIVTDMVRLKPKFAGDGLLTLADTPTALKFEKLIKTAGYQVKLVAPPPGMRRGCDLALEIKLTDKKYIEKILTTNNTDYEIRSLTRFYTRRKRHECQATGK